MVDVVIKKIKLANYRPTLMSYLMLSCKIKIIQIVEMNSYTVVPSVRQI